MWRTLATAAFAVGAALGLMACGGSDGASGTSTPPTTDGALTTTSAPEVGAATTVVVASAATVASSATVAGPLPLSVEEIASIEGELDSIDAILSGVEADLSQD